jgi:zinc/manganese transport system substrate-binding protein
MAAVLAGAVILSACSGSSPETTTSSGDTALQVVAGENFWGNIAAQIGGDRVKVTSVISDPGADPHEYQSNLTDAVALEQAGVVIENGAGYDDFMADLLSAHKRAGRVVLDVADLVHLSGSNPNPHLWYDPDYVLATAKAIETTLADQSPADAATFARNLATFEAGEQHVVDVIDQIKAKYAGAPIAFTERVPGYLVDAAGLTLGTPMSFSLAVEDDRDPSPADNAAFERAITDRTVKVLLYNGQVTDAETEHLKALAATSGLPVVAVTETMPTDAKDFQSWQAAQAGALLTALGG